MNNKVLKKYHKPKHYKRNYLIPGYGQGIRVSCIFEPQINSVLKTTLGDHKIKIGCGSVLFFISPIYFLMYLEKSG